MTTPAGLPAYIGTLSVRYTVDGQEAVNVLGVRTDGGTSGTVSSQEAADALLAGWWAAVRPSLTDSCVLTGATMRGASLGGPLVFEAALPSGTLTGASSASNEVLAVSAVINLKSTRGGRSGMGRIYLPAVPQGNVLSDGRTLNPTWRDTLQTAVQTFATTVYGGARLAVVSRKLGEANLVTTAQVRPVVGIQRGRLYG